MVQGLPELMAFCGWGAWALGGCRGFEAKRGKHLGVKSAETRVGARRMGTVSNQCNWVYLGVKGWEYT